MTSEIIIVDAVALTTEAVNLSDVETMEESFAAAGSSCNVCNSAAA
jgi:hypothetical protein